MPQLDLINFYLIFNDNHFTAEARVRPVRLYGQLLHPEMVRSHCSDQGTQAEGKAQYR